MIENYVENLNTLEEQVLINKNDIAQMKPYLKEAYSASREIPQTQRTVGLFLTNAPSGTQTGWLIDTAGNLFKIVGNSIVSIPQANDPYQDELLYIEFFTSIRGAKGERGPQGNPGERGPQGPTGATGSQGPSGVTNLTSINLQNGEESVLYDATDGITINSQGMLIGENETSAPAVEMNIPLIGSDEIVFDATEDGKHVQAHLDQNISNKVNGALQLPAQAPSATQLVGINTARAQTMINVGDGLSLENGTLKATGGSGGGELLYQHEVFLKISDLSNSSIGVTFVSHAAERYTSQTFTEHVNQAGAFVLNYYIINDGKFYLIEDITTQTSGGVASLYANIKEASFNFNASTNEINLTLSSFSSGGSKLTFTLDRIGQGF